MSLPGRKSLVPVTLVVALLVVGCGGTGPTVPTGVSVNGLVVDVDGQPLSDWLVYIAGRPTEVSGEDGSFTFEEVTTPYDLTVANVTDEFSHTFLGLTTTSPTIVPLAMQLAAAAGTFSADIAGDLVNATYTPLPANHRARVCAEGVGRVVLGCTTVVGGAAFTVFARWTGNSSATVRLRAFIYETDANGLATNIVASGTTTTFALSDGDGVMGENVTLVDDTAQDSVSVTVALPTGFSLLSSELIATYSDFASISPGSGPGPSATETLIAPQHPGAAHTVLVQAMNDDVVAGNSTVAWSAGVDLADPVALELPVPPTLVTPVEAASGVDIDTDFTVTNPEGGVLTFVFQPVFPQEGPTYAVSTVETTTKIPNLSTLGIPLPASADYGWVLLATPDSSTTDEAVGSGGLLDQFVQAALISDGGAPAPDTSGRISTSPSRTFTTD